jgi:predicted O-methyltransferase YrrM
MFINGKEYFEGEHFEGIPDELFDFERPQKPDEGVYKKVGGLCVGKSIVEGIISQMDKCSRYLEIGTFDGIALSVFAEKFPDKQFHAVDSFSGDGTTGGGCLNYFIQNCQSLDNVFLYYGKSVDVLSTVPGKFQVIFVDGSHKYENVKYDLFYSYENLLESGGSLLFHDYTMEGVGPAVDELMKKYKLTIKRDGFNCQHFRKK